MAKDIKPTRSELLKLRRKIKLAKSGHSLLQRKRDGLIREFFKVFEKAKEMKSELNQNFKKATDSINLARAIEGTFSVKSAALGRVSELNLNVNSKMVMGVRVPEIDSDSSVLEWKFNERGYGVIGTSAYIDDAAKSYGTLIKNIIIAAEIETTLKKLLMEIGKTKRRVNALEFNIIPAMELDAKFIQLRLEEMEREDTFRLKRFKRKQEKAQAV